MADEITFTDEQQKHIDKIATTARKQGREKAQKDATAQAAKDKEAADQAALVANKEWQKLADRYQARATELEPLVAQVEQYEGMVTGLLKSTIKELGDAAKTAVDGLPASMTAIDKLNWVTKNKALFQVTGKTAGVGTPAAQSLGKTKLAPDQISDHHLGL